jgi:predicted nuclease of predicted toxin-antitoxin system
MFLANENFPLPSIKYLRAQGLDVTSIQEEFQGISDLEVVKIAQLQHKIILTFDSDYGELIFRYSLENPPSVIYFRDKGNSPQHAGKVLSTLIKGTDLVFTNSFTVVEKEAIRQRNYK